jgi:Rieske Fe-S protein
METLNWSRREFFTKIGQQAVAGAILAPIMNTGLFAKSRSIPATRGPILLDLIKPENLVLNKTGGAMKIPDPHDKRKPIIVTRLSETEFAAFSSKCTHMGCEVPLPVNNSIICPCHKAIFDARGKVTRGPAKKDLRPYTVALNGSILTITETGTGQ